MFEVISFHLMIIRELFLQQTGPLLHAGGDGVGLGSVLLVIPSAVDVIITK